MLRTAGYEVQITNSGRPFDTTAGMLSRLDSAVPDRTDLVILQPGANDRRFFVSAERRANNIAEIHTSAEGVGSRLSSSIPFFRTNTTASTVSTSQPGAHAKIAAELMPRVITKIQTKQTSAKVAGLRRAG